MDQGYRDTEKYSSGLILLQYYALKHQNTDLVLFYDDSITNKDFIDALKYCTDNGAICIKIHDKDFKEKIGHGGLFMTCVRFYLFFSEYENIFVSDIDVVSMKFMEILLAEF